MKKTTFYLIAVLTFMMTSIGAMAQGGASPYLNSTHTYTVIMENGSNTEGWVIANASGVALSPQPAFTPTKVGTTAKMVITWASPWTVAGTDYKILFTETGTCIAKRELPVSVIANNFFLTMNADGSECHDLTGTVLAPAASGNTTLNFTANLNKDAGFTIDSWQFDFTVNVVTGYTLQSVKVNNGLTLGTSGSYTGQSVAPTSTTASIEVVINGPVESGTIVTIALANGKAIKGTATTPDNGTGDKNQVLTVNALPATSVISAD